KVLACSCFLGVRVCICECVLNVHERVYENVCRVCVCVCVYAECVCVCVCVYAGCVRAVYMIRELQSLLLVNGRDLELFACPHAVCICSANPLSMLVYLDRLTLYLCECV